MKEESVCRTACVKISDFRLKSVCLLYCNLFSYYQYFLRSVLFKKGNGHFLSFLVLLTTWQTRLTYQLYILVIRIPHVLFEKKITLRTSHFRKKQNTFQMFVMEKSKKQNRVVVCLGYKSNMCLKLERIESVMSLESWKPFFFLQIYKRDVQYTMRFRLITLNKRPLLSLRC